MTPATAARPLARSLAPLPDESLPGYVLRLAHRLARSPARIAELTHLAPAGAFARAQPMLTMTPGQAGAFAAATRLAPGQASRLCLADCYAGRYPPLRLDAYPRRAITAITRNGWVLTASTRYCPQCLAGDGSEIQQRHGGAWQQLWRLRVAFACTDHHKLLEHLCPQCASPVLDAKSGSNVGLLPSPHQDGLHPAQCRTRHCNARLDMTPGPGGPPGTAPEALKLQARILQMLDPAGPAQAAWYFDLLALTHNMVMLSWPDARPLAGPAALREAADAHVLQARHASEQARAADRIMEANPPMRRLPVPSSSTAGLLLAADQILGWPDLAGLPGRLAPLTEAASREPRAWYPLRIHPAWPPEVRHAFLPKVHGFAVPPRRSTIAPIPSRHCAYRACNVPQRLPADWHDQYLAHLAGPSAKHLRRAAALKLVELAEGHPWSSAARLLRIPRHNAELAIFSTRRWMDNNTNRDAFDQAIENIARHLDTTTPHLDYATRRDALQSWALPPDHWHGISHELEIQTTHGRGHRHAITDARHQVLSVIIWTRITHGEHLFAPAVLQDKAEHAHAPRTAKLAHQAGEILQSHGSYATLKAIAAGYADALATHIDQASTTDGFTWTPPTPMTTTPAPRDTRRRHARGTEP